MKGFHYHDTLNNRVNHFLVGFRVKVRALMATSPVITGHGVRRGGDVAHDEATKSAGRPERGALKLSTYIH